MKTKLTKEDNVLIKKVSHIHFSLQTFMELMKKNPDKIKKLDNGFLNTINNFFSKECIRLFKEEKKGVLPISIFNRKMGMLEAATLYMKDKLNLSFNEIARLLKRNYQTIWTSYDKAKRKMKK